MTRERLNESVGEIELKILFKSVSFNHTPRTNTAKSLAKWC